MKYIAHAIFLHHYKWEKKTETTFNLRNWMKNIKKIKLYIHNIIIYVPMVRQKMGQKKSISFLTFRVLISFYLSFLLLLLLLLCTCRWPHGAFDCIFYQNNSMKITQQHGMHICHGDGAQPHIFCKMSSRKQQQLAILTF